MGVGAGQCAAWACTVCYLAADPSLHLIGFAPEGKELLCGQKAVGFSLGLGQQQLPHLGERFFLVEVKWTVRWPAGEGTSGGKYGLGAGLGLGWLAGSEEVGRGKGVPGRRALAAMAAEAK